MDSGWVRMRLGHWTSADREHWTRVATIRESSGEFAGADPRAALWSPLPVWDDGEERWNLFYVAYRSKPGDGTAFTLNYGALLSQNVNWDANPQTLLTNIQTALNAMFGANNTRVLSSATGQYDIVFSGFLSGHSQSQSSKYSGGGSGNSRN